MTIRGVLFDIDDTLFDYSTSEQIGLLKHLDVEGLLELFPSPADAVAVWREVMEEEYARFLAGELTFTGQQLVRTRRFLARAGSLPADGISDHEASVWFTRYNEFRIAAWSAFPDAGAVLRTLAPRFRLGVVSNSSLAHQRNKLRTIGLLHHFGDSIVCSAEHGAPKPDPSIFLAGCATLGLPAHQVAYVGDKYEIDALGAREAGLHSYWLDRAISGIAPAKGITVIRSLEELVTDLNGTSGASGTTGRAEAEGGRVTPTGTAVPPAPR
ncbi:putative hydrolase of the HAD superfamily [Streptosporangium becharense]|uniref:Putative hydrolase of the HAD superfamily n=1 Tax=Streptosporangium becharense TaxID=1816182 RepID=A0A7W9II45_9ACTN|nr:HAD family hydrolase [Streptosporangium becharense]MBB2912692.1 putative hydrolase of the HAD superfamily [Streptosporangium becharense]MBB5820479.1 putative hydrolase of the HAD superfamily [Streptosporangium becharense]